MIDGKSVLAVITARGGSSGVPRKNVRDVGGKPLIAWTIEASHGSQYVDQTILSTDDDEIISVAGQWDCEAPFVRPVELANGETPGFSVLVHALETVEETFDYAVLLQPTSPLRTTDDIDKCIEICVRSNAPACVSVTEPHVSPYRMYRLDEKQRIQAILERPANPHRRQDLPTVHALNGAVYVVACDWFLLTQQFCTPDTLAYVMPPERSIDIDIEVDLITVQAIIDARDA